MGLRDVLDVTVVSGRRSAQGMILGFDLLIAYPWDSAVVVLVFIG
jgi:hypothetical protein